MKSAADLDRVSWKAGNYLYFPVCHPPPIPVVVKSPRFLGQKWGWTLKQCHKGRKADEKQDDLNGGGDICFCNFLTAKPLGKQTNYEPFIIYLNCICIDICIVFVLCLNWICIVLVSMFVLATFCPPNRLIAHMQWEANKLWALSRFKQTIIDGIETKVKVFDHHWLFSFWQILMWREILISFWNLMVHTAIIQKTGKKWKPKEIWDNWKG